MQVKLSSRERELLRQASRAPIESRYHGEDVPGLRALECAGYVLSGGHHGWSYRITDAGRAALPATQEGNG